mgnify:CR=1 FL=1
MSRVFNGSAGYLRNTTDNIGITAYPFTIGFWVKASVLANNTLVDYRNDSVGVKYFRCNQLNTGFLRVQAVQSATASVDAQSAYSIDTWVPFIAVYNTNLARVDGPGTTDSASSTTAQTYVTNSSPQIRFGSAIGGVPINGKMAHLTVWNVALSEANIDSFLAADDPDTIDAANQTRYWDLLTTSLTDSRNSVVLSEASTTFDGADNPVISSGATPDIIGDISVGFLVQSTFNPAAQGTGGGASKKNKQAYLIY